MITIATNLPMLLGAATVTPSSVYYFDFSGAPIKDKAEKTEVENVFYMVQDEPAVRLRKANRIITQENFLRSDDREREIDNRKDKNRREYHNRSKYVTMKRNSNKKVAEQ